MGKTKIEWTAQHLPDGTIIPGFTFNPWLGCTKVSDGCKNCYAEMLMDKRYGRVKWGPQGTRQRTSDENWEKPLRWNRQAGKKGQRYRVFCASLADVFEDRPELQPWRMELFNMILDTPNLDWLLLTKRPENIKPLLQAIPVLERDNIWDHLWIGHDGMAWQRNFPNVWLGTSVENQDAANKRIPELLKLPAKVRFLSMEPLLGPVDLESLRFGRDYDCEPICDESYDALGNIHKGDEIIGFSFEPGIHLCIVGGESGHHARPMHPQWAKQICYQCFAAGVAVNFKQWGEYMPEPKEWYGTRYTVCSECGVSSEFGAICDHPRQKLTTMVKVGKHAAGRLLDGREWNESPTTV